MSRGSANSRASDFGGLEVFGGASIGHTDPFRVIAALDEQMAAEIGYSGSTHAQRITGDNPDIVAAN